MLVSPSLITTFTKSELVKKYDVSSIWLLIEVMLVNWIRLSILMQVELMNLLSVGGVGDEDTHVPHL